MRVQRPMCSHITAQAEFFTIGGQQQLNSRSRKADTMVEAFGPVFGVNAFQRHHGHEHLRVRYGTGITGEKRFYIEWPWGFDDEVDLIGGNIHAGHPINDLVHLRNDDTAFIGSCLDDRRRVFRIRAGIEIALPICTDRSDQRYIRREIDVVAREKLNIGMDRAQFDLALVSARAIAAD